MLERALPRKAQAPPIASCTGTSQQFAGGTSLRPEEEEEEEEERGGARRRRRRCRI